jgi:peptidylprolyl isomerase
MAPLAVLISLPIALAGCGSDSTHGSKLPEVSSSFGQKPVVKLPKGDASPTLQSKTLVQGTGAAVRKGQFLVAHYLGETWRDGNVFDESYSKKAPAVFQIGVGKVIPGWDKSLVGVKAGSRVVLSVPPGDGYGADGNSQAGIKGDDTLVFVVDVLGGYDQGAGPHGRPAPASPAGLPTVTGVAGKKPTITIPHGVAPPAKLTIVPLIIGDGPPIHAGQSVVQQYAVSTWANGKSLGSTWEEGSPVARPMGAKQLLPGWEKALTGARVGSRILAVLPPSAGFGTAGNPSVGVKPGDTLVFVIDVLGAY